MKIGKVKIHNGIIIGGVVIAGVVVYTIIKRKQRDKLISELLLKINDVSTQTGTVDDLKYSNAFNPTYYKKVNGAKLLTDKDQNTLATKIYDSKGFFNDDEDSVYAVFKLLTAKTQVSILSEKFYLKYKKDLYAFLTDMLSDSEMKTVQTLINKMTEK